MPATTAPSSVTSAELVRQFGRWQDQATSQPVLVTHHGRDRIMLVSVAQYQELASRGASAAPQAEPSTDVAAMEQVMDHVGQGFVAFAPDMTVTAINAAACAFLKVSRTTVVGQRLPERMPGVEDSLGYANLQHAAASGTVTTLEMPSFAFEGRWLLFQTFPFADGSACLFRDITDELEARRHADAKTAALAAMVAHGGVGRARLSMRGTFVEVDPVFAGFAGFTPEGLQRARLTDIVTPALRVAAARSVEAVLEGGAATALDLRLLARSGAEVDVRLGLAPLRTAAGASGAIVIASLTNHVARGGNGPPIRRVGTAEQETGV